MSNLTISQRVSLLKLSAQALSLYVQLKINQMFIRLFNTTQRRIDRRSELMVRIVAMNLKMMARFAELGLHDEVTKRLNRNKK